MIIFLVGMQVHHLVIPNIYIYFSLQEMFQLVGSFRPIGVRRMREVLRKSLQISDLRGYDISVGLCYSIWWLHAFLRKLWRLPSVGYGYGYGYFLEGLRSHVYNRFSALTFSICYVQYIGRQFITSQQNTTKPRMDSLPVTVLRCRVFPHILQQDGKNIRNPLEERMSNTSAILDLERPKCRMGNFSSSHWWW